MLSSGKAELFPQWFLYCMTGWSEKALEVLLVSVPISVMCAWLTLHCCAPSLIPPNCKKAKCMITALFHIIKLFLDLILLSKKKVQAIGELGIGVLWALICPPCRSPLLFFWHWKNRPHWKNGLLVENSLKLHGAEAANDKIWSTNNSWSLVGWINCHWETCCLPGHSMPWKKWYGCFLTMQSCCSYYLMYVIVFSTPESRPGEGWPFLVVWGEGRLGCKQALHSGWECSSASGCLWKSCRGVAARARLFQAFCPSVSACTTPYLCFEIGIKWISLCGFAICKVVKASFQQDFCMCSAFEVSCCK